MEKTIEAVENVSITWKPVIHKPMYSKSLIFEAAYTVFLHDVFARNIQSVTKEETDETRTLILAGCKKLVLVKKTGQIHMERLVGLSAQCATDIWQNEKLPAIEFWAGPSKLRNIIHEAWNYRLCQFIPAAEICYPNNPDGLDMYKHSKYTFLAVGRRMDGKNTIAAVRTFISFFWNFLVDRNILKLCMAYFGRNSNLNDYNFTVKRQFELYEREKETPIFTPIIGRYVQSNSKLKTWRYKIPLDVLLSARKMFFGELLSPAAWRYLGTQTRNFVLSIQNFCTPYYIERYLPISESINLLAETGEQPPLTFVMWFIESIKNMFNLNKVERSSLLRFIRLAGRESIALKKKKKLTRFISGDLILAWDWFLERERDGNYPISIRILDKNATWNSIMRAQHMWHVQREDRERIRREADALEHKKFLEKQATFCWKSELDVIELDEITVLPLTTGKDLIEEGAKMRHCVGDYINACLSGRSRIFSLKSDEENATLELINDGGKQWKVRQIFGISNKEVSKQMKTASRIIANRYSAIPRTTKFNEESKVI